MVDISQSTRSGATAERTKTKLLNVQTKLSMTPPLSDQILKNDMWSPSPTRQSLQNKNVWFETVQVQVQHLHRQGQVLHRN